MILFRRHFETRGDCDGVITGNIGRLMTGDRFNRDLMRGCCAKKNRCVTVYVRDVTEVFWKQMEFCETYDAMFHPELWNAWSRVASLSMTMDYIRTCYKTWRERWRDLETAQRVYGEKWQDCRIARKFYSVIFWKNGDDAPDYIVSTVSCAWRPFKL